ncbi:MAG TPA: hypothetical protein VND97_05570, partial [Beijerinckiaceae bacterium]|nr:hypothetical protein [Beijerinckiaceae bacterium]
PRPAPARSGPPPRPLRPFPTLRPSGGPLFPVRSSGQPGASAPQAGEPTPGEAKDAPVEEKTVPAVNEGRASDPLDTFESLEEEMAKLLGRPGPEKH